MRPLSPSFYIAIILGVTIVILAVFMLQRYVMNESPIIHDFTTPDTIEVGSDLEFRVTAHDADGDKLTVSWNISAGLAGLSQDSSYLKEDYALSRKE